MYRVWYSTESFADYIIDHTMLSSEEVRKCKMYESDANNPNHFHATPDHIRKILYLDAPDIIVEKDNEPVFSVEVSTEAGTGHNAFQRFARLAASVENGVPAFYIYPQAAVIKRKENKRKTASFRWDAINPLVFHALDSVMSIYQIPVFLYYFPSLYTQHQNADEDFLSKLPDKGLLYENDVRYLACPDASAKSMQDMFSAINTIIVQLKKVSIKEAQRKLLSLHSFREHRTWMQRQFHRLSEGRGEEEMSPLSAVSIIPTSRLLNYLARYETPDYKIGGLLRNRDQTVVYKINAKFRGDPYPGALAAIDYLACREGVTFEDRRHNLVLLFGELDEDADNDMIAVSGSKSTIEDFFNEVKKSSRHNLLGRSFDELENSQIPRYFMQVRYGSTYSKVKHIRVYSYFADAILFPDGALWRDA